MSELLAPADADEAAALLAEARAAGRSVLPCGRRTRVSRHDPEAAPDAWLSLAGLDAVHWFDAEDHTCEVGTGLSPAALDRRAADHGLELGALSPGADAGTLGGLFLAPDVSLLHGSLGAPRDQVLGGRWMLADGTVVRTGARVVKSVAGYDLTRLFLGSRGRLAACLSLVLRLRPRPRASRWFTTRHPAAARAALRTLPRLFVQPDADGPAWLQTDGWDPDPALAEPASAADGGAARDACLAAFAAAPRRIAHARPPRDRPRGAFDWLALQEADAGDAPAASPPADAARVPCDRPSPWLRRLAEACAPGVAAFGEASA